MGKIHPLEEVQEGKKKEREGIRYMNTADKMNTKVDRGWRHGPTFTENIPLLKKAEAKAQTKVVFGCIS
jgi:hypothetical protein